MSLNFDGRAVCEKADPFVGSGEIEGDLGSDFLLALHFELAAVLSQDAANDQHAQAGAFDLGCFKRLEHGSHGFRGNSRAVIGNGKADLEVGGEGLDSNFARFLIHSLVGISDDIIQRLLDLGGIEVE